MIIPLTDYIHNTKTANIIGSKAANLLGFAKEYMPQSFIISPDAIEEIVQPYEYSINCKLACCNYDDIKSIINTSSDILKILSNLHIKLRYVQKPNVPSIFDFDKLIIRSSSLNEDQDTSAFAGVYASYPCSQADIYSAIRNVISSMFGVKALWKLKPTSIKYDMAILIQEYIEAEYAGVLFTQDPDTGQDINLISYQKGSCDQIVSGMSIPYELHSGYVVDTVDVMDIPFVNNLHRLEKIVDSIKIKIQNNRLDFEWCYYQDKFYILQVRPITTPVIEYVHNPDNFSSSPLLQGSIVRYKNLNRVSGTVLKMESITNNFEPDKILVLDNTNNDWEPFIALSKALITNKGCRTSHAAIACRELGIPALVGTVDASKLLSNGDKVTLYFNDPYIGSLKKD